MHQKLNWNFNSPHFFLCAEMLIIKILQLARTLRACDCLERITWFPKNKKGGLSATGWKKSYVRYSGIYARMGTCSGYTSALFFPFGLKKGANRTKQIVAMHCLISAICRVVLNVCRHQVLFKPCLRAERLREVRWACVKSDNVSMRKRLWWNKWVKHRTFTCRRLMFDTQARLKVDIDI